MRELGTNLLSVALLLGISAVLGLLLAVLLLGRISAAAAASGGAGVVVLGGHGWRSVVFLEGKCHDETGWI